jgi:KDO2-lipid IV(A) lauroyltransferase
MADRKNIKSAVEYAGAKALLGLFGRLPRRLAEPAAALTAWIGFHAARRQRRVGMENLRRAMPELDDARRRAILRGTFGNLARLLVEFSHFPDLDRSNIRDRVIYEGAEHYEDALRSGKGVIFLTAHFGAWELSCFAHALAGHPMKFIVRQLDNPRVDALVQGYRMLSGNRPIDKRNAAREVLRTLRDNGTVGILADQNATREEGVFAEFFGIPAATTPSIAMFAMRTGAAVIPGFLIWDRGARKHRLRFDAPVALVQTGDFAEDVVENTRRFNAVVEGYVRRYPDQWLWIHRRWKTRPEGDSPIY